MGSMEPMDHIPTQSLTLDLFGCPTFSLLLPLVVVVVVGRVALGADATKVFESWFSGRCCALLPRVSLVFEVNTKCSLFRYPTAGRL